jgi:hypothetical protein
MRSLENTQWKLKQFSYFWNIYFYPMNKQAPKGFFTEEDKVKIALNRSYTERFQLLMKLIRINKMLKNAKIIYPK